MLGLSLMGGSQRYIYFSILLTFTTGLLFAFTNAHRRFVFSGAAI